MHFITKIIRDIDDEEVHRSFVGYGRGDYVGPIIEVNIGKQQIDIKSDFGYLKFINEFISNLIPQDDVYEVKGKITGTQPFEQDINELGLVGQYKKTKKKIIFTLDQEMIGSVYRELCGKLNMEHNVFLDLHALREKNLWTIKTKKNIPKPNPKKFDDPKPDFTKAKLVKSEEIVEQLIAEVASDFSEVARKVNKFCILNRYTISDLIVPTNPKLSSRERRLATKRRGILKRIFTPLSTSDLSGGIESSKAFEA